MPEPETTDALQEEAEIGKIRHPKKRAFLTAIANTCSIVRAAAIAETDRDNHYIWLKKAPFPRALVEFLVLAFSDAGDVVFDCFAGSGTSIAAAHVLNRLGYGIELSPAYCDVAVRRIANLTGAEPILAETGQTMAEVAAERAVPVEQAVNPKQRDARRIRHNGAAPFYGSRKKAS
jgi:DNA modification methylase